MDASRPRAGDEGGDGVDRRPGRRALSALCRLEPRRDDGARQGAENDRVEAKRIKLMLTIKRLSLEEAQILIDGAAAKAREIKVPMCIAVTDESGHLITFDRMDGGKVSSISI